MIPVMVRRKPPVKSTSFRLSEDVMLILEELARRQSTTMTSYLEMWLRIEAKRKGVNVEHLQQARREAKGPPTE